MAHFAQLHPIEIEPGVREVIHVSAVDNAKILDGEGQESEALGVARQQRIHGADTLWMQTSYSGSFRKNYAAIGGMYDANRNAFIPPKPEQYPSWVLNEDTCQWEPPEPKPEGVPDEFLMWREETLDWKDTRMLVAQRDFLRRITPEEWKDIDESTDDVVMYFKTMALVDTKPIDSEAQETIDALTYMSFTGKNGGGAIFGEGRMDQILNPTT